MALVGEHQPLSRSRCQAGSFVKQLGHLAWAGGNSLGGQVAWLGMAQHHLRHFCKQRGGQGSTLNLIHPDRCYCCSCNDSKRLCAHLPRSLNIRSYYRRTRIILLIDSKGSIQFLSLTPSLNESINHSLFSPS